MMQGLTLTYSIADQSFERTKSIGILNLSVQLLQALAGRPEFETLTVLGNQELSLRLKLSPACKVENHDRPLRGAWSRAFWDQVGVIAAAHRTGNEWLFLPKGFPSFFTRYHGQLALYVHDTIFDFYQKNFPGRIPWPEKFYFQTCLLAGLRRANLILTNSEFTRAEVSRIATLKRIPAPRIQAVGIGFVTPKEVIKRRPTQDQILVLTGSWPHKRTDLAIDYLDRWQRETNFLGTVYWIGRTDPGLKFPSHDNWRRHQRLEEGEFRRHVRECRASIYFSEYEGFGMPPVEAVLAGACPVYSDLPATREVMMGTGKSFTNKNYAAFASALSQALKVPPQEIEAWSRILLAKHSWSNVADRVIEGLLATDAAGERDQ